jgi:hypothetical protein
MLQSTQDMQCVENCDDPDPKRHVLYEQPVWQTLQMFRTSYPCPPPYPLSCLTIFHSRRNALYALLDLFSCPCLGTDAVATCGDPGFLPVLYTTLSARLRPSPIQLSDESTDDTLDELSESQKVPPERLTGRRILLLWLPALCDLTGTTVRVCSFPLLRVARPELLTSVRLGLCSS